MEILIRPLVVVHHEGEEEEEERDEKELDGDWFSKRQRVRERQRGRKGGSKRSCELRELALE